MRLLKVGIKKPWKHIAAVYSDEDHKLSLFKNGEIVASRKLFGDSLIASETLLTIGLNRQKLP